MGLREEGERGERDVPKPLLNVSRADLPKSSKNGGTSAISVKITIDYRRGKENQLV